jgi:hypothetical protein
MQARNVSYRQLSWVTERVKAEVNEDFNLAVIPGGMTKLLQRIFKLSLIRHLKVAFHLQPP